MKLQQIAACGTLFDSPGRQDKHALNERVFMCRAHALSFRTSSQVIVPGASKSLRINFGVTENGWHGGDQQDTIYRCAPGARATWPLRFQVARSPLWLVAAYLAPTRHSWFHR